MTEDAELPPPPFLAEEGSIELARICISAKHQVMMLVRPHFDDPHNWGIVLADLARQIADAYVSDGNLHVDDEPVTDPAQALERIVEAFEDEMESPTDAPKPFEPH